MTSVAVSFSESTAIFAEHSAMPEFPNSGILNARFGHL